MSEEQSLTEIIEAAVAENSLENTQSNTTEENSEHIDDSDTFVESLVNGADLDEVDEEMNEFLRELDTEDTEDSDSDTDEVDEDLVEDDNDGGSDDDNSIVVKVDGQFIEVSVDELKSGYQRQADYTRKAQALASEKEEFQETVQQFQETISSLEELDATWNENPVQVLAHFAANTDNPTQAVSMLIRELAVSNLLSQEFMDVFGITPQVRQTWSEQSEIETLRKTAYRAETENQTKAEKEEYQSAVDAAIAEYDAQIDSILDNEGYDLTVKQRNAFRQRLAGYARENEITNLKVAYKAMKLEDGDNKRKLAERATSRAKQKKAASVVTRSGSGARGSAAVEDNEQDLTSIIRQAMRDAGGDA
jgi:hypothetical protein